ncbi:DeoR family transcriptional regulator [Exilibacterium tricleocarpae]|uniref:DeoR family transcriptional regulator n=1 Tax=Exilibacterium tricleocarpae TaxID=2591008 RepID=A0A545SS58_9GAMM|nr:DeoR family transcriptional regulator [Exilibacterium tricleocarpae]
MAAARQDKDLPTRQQAILDLAHQGGFVATEQLVRHFGVTPQTIRRDINTLCDLKLLQRYHGGAGLPSSVENAPYADRQGQSPDAKQRIAALTAGLIPNYASLFINIGTTTEAVAKALVGHEGLRVVTNNINVAQILRENPSFEIILAGGTVRNRDGGIIGAAAIEFIRGFRLDYAVIGISGIDADGSLLDFDLREVQVARAIIDSSNHVLLGADESKFGRRAMVRLGDLSDVQSLITSAAPPAPFMPAITGAGIDLIYDDRSAAAALAEDG